jgi:hypothetical protein
VMRVCVCECEVRKCAGTVKMIDRFIIMSSILKVFSGGQGGGHVQALSRELITLVSVPALAFPVSCFH